MAGLPVYRRPFPQGSRGIEVNLRCLIRQAHGLRDGYCKHETIGAINSCPLTDLETVASWANGEEIGVRFVTASTEIKKRTGQSRDNNLAVEGSGERPLNCGTTSACTRNRTTYWLDIPF
jgi:hypothetical protein